ncbi:MAG: YitT family protein [Clostridiales bacterium]|nr:YitT family protein [Clostridiales bacterium]
MKKGNRLLEGFLRYLVITAGCVLYGAGFFVFVKSSGITTGGVTGFVNIVNLITPIPIGFVVMAVNIPLLVISLIVLKWRFTVSTLYGTAVSSAVISLCETFLETYMPLTENTLLAGLAGGLFTGLGLGLIMKNRSSTGGTDIVIKLIHRKWRYLSGGTIHAIIDIMIVVFFFAVTREFDATMYAIITIVVSDVVYDLTLYGVNTSKTVYIITNRSEDIIKELFEKCSCGATILNAEGAYTHQDRKIVLSVVRNQMFPALKDVVKETDPQAFVIVTKSAEIYGEGFSEYREVL